MAKPRMYVVSQDWYFRPWKALFAETQKIRKADVVLFSGGADVSPSLYGQPEGSHTHTFPARDKVETAVFKYAAARGIPMIGICRGAQLLTVMNKGTLIQHVTNHGSSHFIRNVQSGEMFYASSTHHQMMNPYNLPKKDYEVLGITPHPLSWRYLDGEDKDIDLMWKRPEPEVVWYPKTRCLCIQAHPEAMSESSEGVNQFRNWAKRLII